MQKHDGTGMCEDIAVGQYFKALTSGAQRFGNADFHLARFAATLRTAES